MAKFPKKHIDKIIDYMWESELNHFYEYISEKENINIKGHIFYSVAKVKEWINNQKSIGCNNDIN